MPLRSFLIHYYSLEARHDLVERFAAGDELAGREADKWLIDQVKMFDGIGLIFVDVEKTCEELLLTAGSLKNFVGGITVGGIVSVINFLEHDPGAVVHLHFGLVIIFIDLDLFKLGYEV
jgi:hypothetical protein